MAKQVMDIRTGKGFTTAQSDEHQRRWNEDQWKHWVEIRNYDQSREDLNFEIVAGCKIQAVDKRKSIAEKFKENLQRRGIKDPNERLEAIGKPKYNTIINIIFEGNQEVMRKMAFGDQEIKWEKYKDNSSVKRKPEIEEWAKDMYRFAAKEFGEENIIGFYVHLDETTPHIHCTIIPVKDGKISYCRVMGMKCDEISKKWKELHNRLAEVNRKYGLERGDPKEITGARHISTEQYRRNLAAECLTAEKTLSIYRGQLNDIWKDVNMLMKKSKALTTMIGNLEQQRDTLAKEIEALKQSLSGAEERDKILMNSMDEKQKKLDEIENKLNGRKNMLDETQKQLDELNLIKSDIYANIEQLKGELASTVGNSEESVKSYIGAALLQDVINEYKEMAPHMPLDIKNQMDRSAIGDVAINGPHLVTCATLLYVGMLDEATKVAESCGGGVQNDLRWGRDPDDDDRAWAMKCARQARKMMKPAARRILRK